MNAGMEIAAYGVQKNATSVTVIGRSDVPFKQTLGDSVGGMWKKVSTVTQSQDSLSNSAACSGFMIRLVVFLG